jgi:hypothetical protein
VLEKKKIDLGFTKHRDISTGKKLPADSSPMNSPYQDEYIQLVNDMRSDIAAIRHPLPHNSSAPHQSQEILFRGNMSSHVPLLSPLQAGAHVDDDDEWSSASEIEESTPNFSSQTSKPVFRTPPSETPTQKSRQDNTMTHDTSSTLAEAFHTENPSLEEQIIPRDTNMPVRQPSPDGEEVTLVSTLRHPLRATRL